jgi:hypothetical protein
MNLFGVRSGSRPVRVHSHARPGLNPNPKLLVGLSAKHESYPLPSLLGPQTWSLQPYSLLLLQSHSTLHILNSMWRQLNNADLHDDRQMVMDS